MFRRIRTAIGLYRFAAKDARTPTMAKVLPWLSLVYLVWPIDLIPDLLPILGQLDDLGIMILLFIWALRLIPEDVRRAASVRKTATKNVIDV